MLPRFVLLRHECPPDFEKPNHWDFMLESNGVLRTWELRELPAAWATALGEVSAAVSVDAIPLPDHRIAYLDFEGPLTGNRGSVRRCDHGSYRILRDDVSGYVVSLQGERLRGTVRLQAQRLTADS